MTTAACDHDETVNAPTDADLAWWTANAPDHDDDIELPDASE